MPPDHAVFWTKIAERDLEAIIDYIARDNIDAAQDVFAKLRSAAAALASLPQRGRVVPEFQAQGIPGYHELVIGVWRLIYRIGERQVHVLAVFDSRRNLEDVLLDRLTRI